MKQLSCLTICLCASLALAFTAFGGPEPLPSGKEMKEVAPAPPPPCCDWTGFYIGLHAGGQFGHSETEFINRLQDFDNAFGYSESGFVGGGQIGYNWQWHWLVLGPEIDVGYMNLDGRGHLFHDPLSSDYPAESDSDFYTTFRGRIGVALDCWLFYATGGGIGVNYDTRSFFTPDPADFNGHKQDFDWGYTFGGGIERRLGCHWSIKVEYLYFALDNQSFDITEITGGSAAAATSRIAPAVQGSSTLVFPSSGETAGHIVRAGLNYKF